MREMDVLGVRVSIPDNEVVVVLADKVGPIVLPIVIGPREGAAIATAQAGIVPERPQTHDLMMSLLEMMGQTITEVRATKLDEGTFFAEIQLSSGKVIDARPSDAIALALRANCPVKCAETVIDTAGVIMEAEEDNKIVEEFKTFLEDLDPEDFAE